MRNFKALEVSNQGYKLGYMIVSLDNPAMVAVKNIRDGRACITTQVGFGKLYASQKSALKAIQSIKEVYNG